MKYFRSWPGDQHFPLDKQAACYRTQPNDAMVSLIPGMRHGHGAGWNPPDSYAFAESVVREGLPWCRFTASTLRDREAMAVFESSKALGSATLISTSDTGITGSRTWTQSPAELIQDGETGQPQATLPWKAQATLPSGTTAWFINVRSDGATGDRLTVSSWYESVPAREK